ncbi:LLM class flavin-dependent oxidoreductase [Ornithinimicrobium flavum]|uniref:LLM class flavin-dependent oxidoreductase n=1 Tax=Ornithinimicrobium flavum TaxID=1288636 RepID=UPI00106F61A2|nr:LLM class flavin-dependent oxidoreductase [Ornithinimicrobium flavum]
MTDYGHDIRLGIFPTPQADRVREVVDLAVVADTSGIDLVSIQDHPYQPAHADSTTLLTWIAARTSRVEVAHNVANLPLRDPVSLAKWVATLDRLSGGRVHLGLGTGAFWDGIVAAGGPRRSPREAVDALVEAIDIVRQVWRGERAVRSAGEHYAVKGLRAGPVPLGDPQIWIGAYGPRMQRVTGRLADGWLPSMGYLPPDRLPEANARIDEAAEKAGRAPGDVVRLYNVAGLRGSAADQAEQLAGLALEHGMSTFVLATDDADAVRRLGLEVGPALRDLVARERAQRPTALPATPDDGIRLTGELAWDEASRPRTPEPAAPAEYTPEQLAAPRHLVDVHDHLRAELGRVREVVDQVVAGHLDVGQARSVLNTMAMRQNTWTLGAFCQAYCRVVTGHHTLEDRSVFPHLRRAEPGVGPVLDRLEEEHEVIADVLDRLGRALVSLAAEDGYGQKGRAALAELSTSVDLLTDTLLSHLSYEERELGGPLARHGFG